jgi:hypothetical protein
MPERLNMKKQIRTAVAIILLPFVLNACLAQQGNSMSSEQSRVMVSEIMSVCGAMVGEQAEQRINQEWAKYPEAEASRPVIEAVAESLLNNPAATETQQLSQYKKYLRCATGLLVANGFVK